MELKETIEHEIKKAMVQPQETSHILMGRPYPKEYDAVAYPEGFVPPSFRIFDGFGNPRQHLAHFRASCCNINGNDALLFRQFVGSLSDAAFDWYANLPNGSIQSFSELEILFIKRFANLEHHITISDLMEAKQEPHESLIDYILRWRVLSSRCEPQLLEQHAVEILLKSIQGPVAFLLKAFSIKTFEKLLKKASSLMEGMLQSGFPVDQLTPNLDLTAVSHTAKGKRPMKGHFDEPPRVQHLRSAQPQEASLRPQKQPFKMKKSRYTFEEKLNREYSFKREAVEHIFEDLIRNNNLQLPDPHRPDEVGMINHPNYCPYHRMLGHTIEDCFSFNGWLERSYRRGTTVIPEKYLRDSI